MRTICVSRMRSAELGKNKRNLAGLCGMRMNAKAHNFLMGEGAGMGLHDMHDAAVLVSDGRRMSHD